jgi:hypothetical protein
MGEAQQIISKSKYVYYPLTDGGLVTTPDPHRVSRSQLTQSQNGWLTPNNVVSKRPAIGNFGGGSISGTGTTGSTGFSVVLPLQGCSTVRFNGVSYVIVQDSAAAPSLFAFPRYSGNTNWFYIATYNAPVWVLSNSPAQLYDPVLAAPAAFFQGSPGGSVPLLWTGVTTTFLNPTVASTPTVITPTGLSGMNGIYVGLIVNLGQNTAHFEPSSVTVVTATTFTVGTTTQPHAAGELIAGNVSGVATAPRKFTSAATITPRFTETLFSNLFYAGEPTAPTAVYTSNPYFPETFTSNYFQSTIYPGTYQPALIGHNDGVNGGDITGLRRLGDAMIVYKQSAIYRLSLTSLYGDMVWRVEIVCPSVGCTAPNSIVSFDAFHVFLGIDGVYMTTGIPGEMPRKISKNIGTFFDAAACKPGVAPTIQNFTTATAVRYGNMYLLFYDGAGTGVDRGMWVDFANLDADGLPKCGEMIFALAIGGISGVAPMRGPADTGTPFICSRTNNLTGEFGQVGAAGDWGNNIVELVQLVADLFEDSQNPYGVLTQNRVISVIPLLTVGSSTISLTAIVRSGTSGYTVPPAQTVGIPGSLQTPVFSLGDVGFTYILGQAQIQLGETSGINWTLYGVMVEIEESNPVLV